MPPMPSARAAAVDRSMMKFVGVGDLQITEVPASLQAFVDRYGNRDRKQLTLRLV